MIIEGASHFSPIRVDDQQDQLKESDIYQLDDALVGSHPSSVQSLLAKEIIRFLENLEEGKTLPVGTNKEKVNLKYHILDRRTISNIINKK